MWPMLKVYVDRCIWIVSALFEVSSYIRMSSEIYFICTLVGPDREWHFNDKMVNITLLKLQKGKNLDVWTMKNPFEHYLLLSIFHLKYQQHQQKCMNMSANKKNLTSWTILYTKLRIGLIFIDLISTKKIKRRKKCLLFFPRDDERNGKKQILYNSIWTLHQHTKIVLLYYYYFFLLCLSAPCNEFHFVKYDRTIITTTRKKRSIIQ